MHDLLTTKAISIVRRRHRFAHANHDILPSSSSNISHWRLAISPPPAPGLRSPLPPMPVHSYIRHAETPAPHSSCPPPQPVAADADPYLIDAVAASPLAHPQSSRCIGPAAPPQTSAPSGPIPPALFPAQPSGLVGLVAASHLAHPQP